MPDIVSLKAKIKKFNESDNFFVGTLRDLLFVLAFVIIFVSASQLLFGTWTPMVAVESGSMSPNMMKGDIVFKENPERASITTFKEGAETGYTTFNNYGDVILYKPYGNPDATPIIHRAMYYVNKGDPMWTNGPPAPHSGYITKGDNVVTNQLYDQYIGSGISGGTPVKKEWVVGVAKFRIPYVGYVRLLFSNLL